MANDIIPRTFLRSPFVSLPSVWEDIEEMLPTTGNISGLSISEDGQNIYVSAAVPGVDPEDVDISFEKGVLWVKAEKKEEEKGKKFYRKATSSFSYRVTVPGEIDPNIEPEASCRNGIVTVTFVKSPKVKPKKIAVKSGK
ncbi:MAG: Hsp20/alpha crystallin family protein [Candidatus Levybacteria bacterium]|nr:Hsp20/alpha crystallin family protein [Candidatus Levybacteria bacterium]